MKEALLQRRAERLQLAGANDEAASVVELDQSKVGRLSRMDAIRAQAMAQDTAARRALMLRRIDSALDRLEAGNYGRCQHCDEPIPQQRLEFDPAVLYCIGCANELEQGS